METNHNYSPALTRGFVLYGVRGEITETFGTASRTKYRLMYCGQYKIPFFAYA